MNYSSQDQIAIDYARRANDIVRIHNIRSFADDNLEMFEEDNRMQAMVAQCREQFGTSLYLTGTKIGEFAGNATV
jgi:hypothetical protein